MQVPHTVTVLLTFSHVIANLFHIKVKISSIKFEGKIEKVSWPPICLNGILLAHFYSAKIQSNFSVQRVFNCLFLRSTIIVGRLTRHKHFKQILDCYGHGSMTINTTTLGVTTFTITTRHKGLCDTQYNNTLPLC